MRHYAVFAGLECGQATDAVCDVDTSLLGDTKVEYKSTQALKHFILNRKAKGKSGML